MRDRARRQTRGRRAGEKVETCSDVHAPIKPWTAPTIRAHHDQTSTRDHGIKVLIRQSRPAKRCPGVSAIDGAEHANERATLPETAAAAARNHKCISSRIGAIHLHCAAGET